MVVIQLRSMEAETIAVTGIRRKLIFMKSSGKKLSIVSNLTLE